MEEAIFGVRGVVSQIIATFWHDELRGVGLDKASLHARTPASKLSGTVTEHA